MTQSADRRGRLGRWADGVLLPCFDGIVAPEWVRRRVGSGLGGVCLFARNVHGLAQVRSLADSLAAERESVVIAIDEEAGDVTRIDASTGSRFPGAAALGRVDDVALTEAIAREAGDVLAQAGVSLNFAPCADVLADAMNPLIGSRSFGADPHLVARHAAAWVRGQQAASVAACVKHFPGHGDTATDSHVGVAVVNAEFHELRTAALPPFAAAIDAGVAAVMAGHLLVPAIDDLPATVSHRWLAKILRGEMGFAGTIVTDALEMAGVASLFGIPSAAVRALAAGADLLCIGGTTRGEAEIDAIRDAIVDAVVAGKLAEERLADAAARCAAVGCGAVSSPAGVGTTAAAAQSGEGSRQEISVAALDAATRALTIAGPLPRIADGALVLRCAEPPTIAAGRIPWGLAQALDGCVEQNLQPSDPLPLREIDDAPTVVIITRDRHQHDWMTTWLREVRALRPDTILVEMGTSGVDAADAPAIATYGATRAAAAAVARLLQRSPA